MIISDYVRSTLKLVSFMDVKEQKADEKCCLEKHYPHRADLKEGYISDKTESVAMLPLSH